MLAADTADDVRIALMTLLHTHLHEACNAWIDSGERVVRQQAVFQVLRNELSLNVVTAESEAGDHDPVGIRRSRTCESS